MFDDMFRIFREVGVEISKDKATAFQDRFVAEFRHETIYVTDRRPQERARQLAKLGQIETRKIAAATGLSVRTIRRIRNGK